MEPPFCYLKLSRFKVQKSSRKARSNHCTYEDMFVKSKLEVERQKIEISFLLKMSLASVKRSSLLRSESPNRFVTRAGLKPMQPMQLHWAPRHSVWVDQGFLRRFRDPIRVPRIRNRVHTGYLTFSLKKTGVDCSFLPDTPCAWEFSRNAI